MGHLKKIIPALFLLSCQNQKPKPKDKYIVPDNKVYLLQSIADSLYSRDDYQQAIKYFDTLIHLAPQQGEYYYKRGFSYDQIYKRPEVKPAIEDYLKSIELGYRKPDAYCALGLSYMFENDSIAALYFEKSLELRPNKPDVLLFMQQCKLRWKKKHQ